MAAPEPNGSISLSDHERLVNALYKPGADVSQINATLTRYQKSQEGWNFADQLLQSQDDKVRFFGALTFTIKINTDWSTLTVEDAGELRQRLLTWLVRLVRNRDGPVVIRKVCAALVAQFLKSWTSHHYHDQVVLNLQDTIPLIHVLLRNPEVDNAVVEEAIKCFQAWVNYAHGSSVVDASSKDFESLKSLTPLLLPKLADEKLFEVTVEFFTDVLINFPAFFDSGIYASLASIFTSPSATAYMTALKAGEGDEEAQDFSRLLFAYGDATVQDLAQNVHDYQLQRVLVNLLDLLDASGYDDAGLQICSQALEFWQTYTEFATDSLFTAGEEREAWMDVSKEYIAKALKHGWSKIRSPNPEIVASWNSEIRIDFRALRQDYTDLVQASFTLLGLATFEYFAQLALDSLSCRSWYDLEAALFGLNALSDSVAEDPTGDEALSKIFRSSLFRDMMDPAVVVPLQAQVTALGTITNYTSFFERQTDFLPSMLDFLFTFLGHPTLAIVAAKAIASTCSSCRKHLIPQINGFLQAYEPHSQGDPGVREKIVGAIAMIVQALPSDEEKINPLSVLITLVERDADYCYDARIANRTEEALGSGLCALRSLSSIGKGLQMPDDAVIDLETEGNPSNPWILPIGLDLQTRVKRILHAVTGYLSFDNSIIEAGCQVLRTGYKETAPGLFVLPPEVTVDFVAWACESGLGYTGVAYILDTATAMLARKRNASSPVMSNAASKIWNLVLNLIKKSPSKAPIIDPEVIASCINLAEKMIPHHLRSFFGPESLSILPEFFILSLESLVTPEIMPKRAAGSFWAAFVQRHELANDVGEKVYIAMQVYGPQLCHILIRNISGEAERSELDMLSLPLKKLVFAEPRAKVWLSDALQSEFFISDKVDSTARRLWLQKIMGLRGGAQTNSAVKELWMDCRGGNMDYAS
ncbi:MAG: hypothetical protein Q9195_002590 [Heterodermia aff. obscurata]